MSPYNQEFITWNQWKELSRDSLSSISEKKGVTFQNKVEKENTNQKIISLTMRLTLFQQISAFFLLLTQQLFSRDAHTRALLPKAWKCLIKGNYVESYIYEKASWSSLPTDSVKHITTYLNPSDLASLSQTSTKFTEEIAKDGWGSAAQRIQCPLNSKLRPKPQVQAFIRELKKKAEVLQNLPYVAPLIKSNTIDDLCNLQKLIKARDTAVVWKALAEKIQRQVDVPNQDSFNKIEDLLEIPEQFTAWCKTHQNALIHVRTLDLSKNQLTFLPSEIGALTQLTELELGNNQLEFLPSEIGNLTQLIVLRLSENQVTSLPSEIGNQTHLKALDLSNNQLTSLPSEIGNLTQLILLKLDSNQLTSLPSEIGNLTQLIWFNLFNNPLTSLPKELYQLESLWSSGISLKLRISLWFNFAMSRLSAFFESFIAHLNKLQEKIRGKRSGPPHEEIS